jgi:hypothetical protein
VEVGGGHLEGFLAADNSGVRGGLHAGLRLSEKVEGFAQGWVDQDLEWGSIVGIRARW